MALDLSALDAALSWDVGGANGVPLRAALDRFAEDPANPRFESDGAAFEALVEDVKARGILQPVVVRDEAGGVLRIRFGSRRIRAARAAGLVDAPYVVTGDERQFDDYAQVAENQRRLPLQPLELAAFIARKIAAGEKKNLVAERLGLHPSTLTHLLCLAGDVPPFVMELYQSGRCRSARYLYQLRGLWEVAPERVIAACADVEEIDLRLIESLSAAVQGRDGLALTEGEGMRDGAVAPERAVGQPPQAGRRKAGKKLAVGSGGEPGIAADSAAPGTSRWQSVRLHGEYRGRSVVIDLCSPQSSEDEVEVRFDDTGVVAQAMARDVVLVRVLREAGRNGSVALT